MDRDVLRFVVGGAAVTVPTVVAEDRVVELRLVVTTAVVAVVGLVLAGFVLLGLTVVGLAVVGLIVVGLIVVGLAVVGVTDTTVEGFDTVTDGVTDDEEPMTVVSVVGVTDEPLVAGVEVGTETESDVATELGVVEGWVAALDVMLGAAAVARRRTVVGTLI
ncbi:MAG: hypothetical protein ACRBK7_20350 [Acidimicrobiales bacterium]